MATPHVAGAVALLWAAAPSLDGDIAGTRDILDTTAHDMDDTHCGGTADFNNVWGEGKLDIKAAMDAAPHTAATVSGKVTDEKTGGAVTGATVTAKAREATRTTVTDADGSYRLTLAPGTYELTLSGYGYAPSVGTVTLTEGQAADAARTLAPVPHHKVVGTVLDTQGKALGGAEAKLTDAPVDAVTTGADGTFTLPDVDEGSFTMAATPAGPVLCNVPQESLPSAVGRPQQVPLVDGLPRAEAFGQLLPLHPGAQPVDDPVDHLPVIAPPHRRKRLQHRPPPRTAGEPVDRRPWRHSSGPRCQLQVPITVVRDGGRRTRGGYSILRLHNWKGRAKSVGGNAHSRTAWQRARCSSAVPASFYALHALCSLIRRKW